MFFGEWILLLHWNRKNVKLYYFFGINSNIFLAECVFLCVHVGLYVWCLFVLFFSTSMYFAKYSGKECELVVPNCVYG